jgi:cell division protein FtsQ
MFFFRKRNIVLLIGIVISALCIYTYHRVFAMKPLYPVEEIVFIDNKRLTDEELGEIAKAGMRKSLLTVSCREISRRLLESPWIRSASVRKEFPGTLAITIQETEPFALLDIHEHLFIIDEKGKFLEELKDDAVPFLPIIVSDPYKEREGFSEALFLVRVLNDKGLILGKDHIEVIAHKPQELSIEMDETVVKIGAGGYDEKLERFLQLEKDLRERNIPVDCIDLRFDDKAIVKPITAKKVME